MVEGEVLHPHGVAGTGGGKDVIGNDLRGGVKVGEKVPPGDRMLS